MVDYKGVQSGLSVYAQTFYPRLQYHSLWIDVPQQYSVGGSRFYFKSCIGTL